MQLFLQNIFCNRKHVINQFKQIVSSRDSKKLFMQSFV